MSLTGARLAVSNLAWAGRPADRYEELLTACGVTGLEVAPTTVLGAEPGTTSAVERAAVRDRLADRGLRVAGVQSLYFGHPELQLLASGAERQRFVEFTCRISDVCADLGGSSMVLGSPANRRRDGLPLAEATARAAGTLREIGEHCAQRGTYVVVEALGPEFGCEFGQTLAEVLELHRLADSAGVRAHLDTGTSPPSDGERLPASTWSSLQVSGGVTGVVGDDDRQRAWARVLGAEDGGPSYDGWVSLELPPVGGSDADNEARIRAGVRVVREVYRCG